MHRWPWQCCSPGGLARRLGGGDKPLRLLAGRPLLDHVLDRVRPQVARDGAERERRPGPLRRMEACRSCPIRCRTIPVRSPACSPGCAGRGALGPVPRTSCRSPTDTPFLPRDLVARLRRRAIATAPPIACRRLRGRTHPVVALWPVSLADALEAALARRRAQNRCLDRPVRGRRRSLRRPPTRRPVLQRQSRGGSRGGGAACPRTPRSSDPPCQAMRRSSMTVVSTIEEFFVKRAGQQAGDHRAGDGREPEQPELRRHTRRRRTAPVPCCAPD